MTRCIVVVKVGGGAQKHTFSSPTLALGEGQLRLMFICEIAKWRNREIKKLKKKRETNQVREGKQPHTPIHFVDVIHFCLSLYFYVWLFNYVILLWRKRALTVNWEMIENNQFLRPHFPQKPTRAYRRNTSLKDILVRSKINTEKKSNE